MYVPVMYSREINLKMSHYLNKSTEQTLVINALQASNKSCNGNIMANY